MFKSIKLMLLGLLVAINMSADQYLKMKEFDNQKLAIEKGNSVNIIMGNAQPMFSVGK